MSWSKNKNNIKFTVCSIKQRISRFVKTKSYLVPIGKLQVQSGIL